MNAVSIGPFLFTVGIVAVALGLLAAQGVATFLRRRGLPDVGGGLWRLLLAALLVARLAWVIAWWDTYRQTSWWQVFNIRDGGFVIWAGVAVLVIGAVGWMWRRPLQRMAVALAAGSGLVVWAVVLLVSVQLQRASTYPLPDVNLTGIDGQPVDVRSLAGQPTVINLWATWCGPCRREMLMLVTASHDLDGVRFVFVDQGEDAATVRAWLAAATLAPKHVLLDSHRQLTHYYQAPGYPTTLFVDAAGRLRDTRIGELSRASLNAHLQSILPSRSPE